jgi:uncharacterized protein (TIGR03085 family)
MSTHAHRERLLLAELLESAGPDAPTLCEGWTTRDLAVHLVVRERRADAYLGGPIKRLAARGERIQQGFRDMPYAQLLGLFRSGPSRLSPLKVSRVDELANTVEYFVHGEDVRRAQPDWTPRELDEEFSDQLWRRLEQGGRLFGRKSPVGLVLRRPDGQTVVAKRGKPVVTLTGEPAELLMFVFGRGERAQLKSVEGDDVAVRRLRASKLAV